MYGRETEQNICNTNMFQGLKLFVPVHKALTQPSLLAAANLFLTIFL